MANAMVTSAVVARELTVKRGGVAVLRDLNLEVPAGAVTGLLGPSGSGKTTLLRAIVGVQANVSGDLTVLGQPAGSPELRQRIGYATQAASIYSDLTVAQNLSHFAALGGLRGTKRSQVVRSLLAEVGLEDHADQLGARLSGGERSRVSLAIALVTNPELLVLDEPTVGLDPVLRRSLWNLFHQLAATGRTLLVSSHVMDEASRCDRLLLLRRGVLVADTTPVKLLEQTGAIDAESAFLRLIDQEEAVDS